MAAYRCHAVSCAGTHGARNHICSTPPYRCGMVFCGTHGHADERCPDEQSVVCEQGDRAASNRFLHVSRRVSALWHERSRRRPENEHAQISPVAIAIANDDELPDVGDEIVIPMPFRCWRAGNWNRDFLMCPFHYPALEGNDAWLERGKTSAYHRCRAMGAHGAWYCNRIRPRCHGHRDPSRHCDDLRPATGGGRRVPATGNGSTVDTAPRMEVGLNIPWEDCGWDWGTPPAGWNRNAQHLARLERKLVLAKSKGCTVSRWWVLGDGTNYPEGRSTSSPRALTPLSDSFKSDYDRMLDAHPEGMTAIPSWISFEWFKLPELRALALTPDSGTALIETTLRPLLSRGPREKIYAWEVMNEPDWVVKHGHAEAEELCFFLQNALEAVHADGHKSTIGFTRPNPDWLTDSFRRYLSAQGAAGRYIHQYHYYPRTELWDRLFGAQTELAAQSECLLPGKTIIGEFAVSDSPDGEQKHWPDDPLRTVEYDRTRFLHGRLSHALASGYPLAMMWSTNAMDWSSGLDEETWAQVHAFTRGRPP